MSALTAPGWRLPCEHNPVRLTCPHRGKGCQPPAEPIAPQAGDPCPVCRRNGANYGTIACKDEHFQRALAKHKLDSENWHKTWDELPPATASPALGDEPSAFEPELPAGPVPMADHQVISFRSAIHEGRIEWNRRFERYEATATPRDWKKGKRLPPQGAYFAGTVAELKLKLREQVVGVRFVDEPEVVEASADSRDARPDPTFEEMLAAHPRSGEIKARFAESRQLVERTRKFLGLFSGNPKAHYVRDGERPVGKQYLAIDQGIDPAPVRRHLLGEEPSVLSIPINAGGLSHWGCLDVDRHKETDPAVDHAQLARTVTELHLSLVVCRSKNPKSAHLFLFLKESQGCPAAVVRRLLTNYREQLQVAGEVEIFPKQEQLGPEQLGNGVNLPYFGGERIAFGNNGEELSLDGFLSLAAERTVYGSLLEQRLPKEPSADPQAAGDRHPITAARGLEIHQQNIDALRQAKIGDGNKLLNTCAFFAGRLAAARVLKETEGQLTNLLLNIVRREWAKPHPEEGARATIEGAWASGFAQPLAVREETEAEIALEKMNKEFFVITNYGNKCRVAWFDKEDHPVLKGYVKLAHQGFGDFKNAMLNKTVFVGTDDTGKSVYKKIGPWWLEHHRRREYSKVVFLPGQDVAPDKLNLWRGFSCEPVKGGCSLYLNHLREVICDGNTGHYEYALKWMARAVQRPNEQGHVALVWRGDKGAGKNIAANGFGDLFGSHCMTISNAEHLVGRFNAHLRAKCVLIANEAFYAGNKAHEATLKNLITEPTLPIEQKFVDAETDVNLLHLIVLSNNEWVVPASEKERRFFMLDVSDARVGDHKYFDALVHELSHGGREALLYHLLHLDLTGFNVRNVPPTGALRSQMAESLTGIEAVWYECLVRGELPGHVNQDGTAWLRGSGLVNWAADQKRHGWSGISEQKVGYLFGTNPRGKDKGMGFTKGQTELFATGQRNQGWKIPNLKKARELWSQKRFDEAWDESAGGWRAVERT